MPTAPAPLPAGPQRLLLGEVIGGRRKNRAAARSPLPQLSPAPRWGQFGSCPAHVSAPRRAWHGRERSAPPSQLGAREKPCFPAFPPGKGHLGEAQPSPKDPPAASSCSFSIPGAGLCSPPPSCCSSRAETPPLPPPSRFFLADSWNFCSGSTVLL